MDNNRRRLLQRSAAGLLAVHAPGCCLFIRRPTYVCPSDPSIDDPLAPLTIDVHAHLFNASDLQVEQFIKRVALRKGGSWGRLAEPLGAVLERVGWATAPSGERELQELSKLRPGSNACDIWSKQLGAWRQDQYLQAREALAIAAMNAHPELMVQIKQKSLDYSKLTDTAEGMLAIDELPATYDEYQQLLDSEAAGGPVIKRKTFTSALAFVVEHFQYRYVSAHNYLRSYDRGKRKVDLLIADMVDYDYWLKKGDSPPTTLQKQIEVMERISILTGGRVHAFVPFCPYRQAMHDQNRAAGKSPLELVQDAILNRGAIGVKLYPPMGFAPSGNAQIQARDADFWRRRDWLGDLAQASNFGNLLDDALKKLYRWCSDPANDVPIMAHSNLSNGPADDFEALNGWQHWASALSVPNKPNRLRISFGHFGNPSGNPQGDAQARGLLSLLGTAASPGQNAFIDASYFTDVLDDRGRLIQEMVALIKADASGQRALPKRAMYGTDWKMMLIEHGVNGYLEAFDGIIADVVKGAANEGITLDGFNADFFGVNAVRFLGLKSGPARTRLEAFYRRTLGTFRPTWMKKVDRLSI